jgi:hypothetical protein
MIYEALVENCQEKNKRALVIVDAGHILDALHKVQAMGLTGWAVIQASTQPQQSDEIMRKLYGESSDGIR